MKKVLFVLLLTFAVFSMVGCGKKEEGSSTGNGGSSTGGDSATVSKTFSADEVLANYGKNGFTDYMGKKVKVTGVTFDEEDLFSTDPSKMLFVGFSCDNIKSLNVTVGSKYDITGVVKNGTSEYHLSLENCSVE